jgi:hypothetical protein
MAEEAAASFHLQYQFISSDTRNMDQADLIAVQQLLRADEEAAELDAPEVSNAGEDEDGEAEGDGEEGPTYEHLIALGQRIGDVKAERWAFR